MSEKMILQSTSVSAESSPRVASWPASKTESDCDVSERFSENDLLPYHNELPFVSLTNFPNQNGLARNLRRGESEPDLRLTDRRPRARNLFHGRKSGWRSRSELRQNYDSSLDEIDSRERRRRGFETIRRALRLAVRGEEEINRARELLDDSDVSSFIYEYEDFVRIFGEFSEDPDQDAANFVARESRDHTMRWFRTRRQLLDYIEIAEWRYEAIERLLNQDKSN